MGACKRGLEAEPWDAEGVGTGPELVIEGLSGTTLELAKVAERPAASPDPPGVSSGPWQIN